MKRESQKLVRTLDLVHEGRLVEIRILKKKQITSGYYLDYVKAAHDVLTYDAAWEPEGIYMTLQEIHPGLIARAPNLLISNPAQTTSDRDVIGYRWMLIDIDPVRPAGISSSAAELLSAAEVGASIPSEPGDIQAFSGNGYHILRSRGTSYTGQDLARYAQCYNSSRAAIDLTTAKPSQITKLYGTWARKGFEFGDREWRQSKLLN